jgi:hypothetical protein
MGCYPVAVVHSLLKERSELFPNIQAIQEILNGSMQNAPEIVSISFLQL